jgi:hypothetical protein
LCRSTEATSPSRATLEEGVTLAEELNHWRNLPNAYAWLAVATLQCGDATVADEVLLRSLASYPSRLRCLASAHPYPAELIEALVAAAYNFTAQGRFEEAGAMPGCADALNSQPQAPTDPFLSTIAEQIRKQRDSAMSPMILQRVLACGRAAEARELLAPTSRPSSG